MVEVPLVPLGNLLRESPRNGLSPRPSDAPPGLPILRISAATSRQDGIVDEADYKYLEVGEREALQYRVQPGDLLACRFNGNLHFVGRFALYRGYLGKHQIYPDKLIRFRVDTARVLPDFVLLVVNSRSCRAVIESFCSTTAGNIGISAANLKTVPIPVPPLQEQCRIVRRVEDLTTRIERARGLRREAVQLAEAARGGSIAECFPEELDESWPELAQIVAYIENGWSPRCLPERVGPGEWGVLKVGAVSSGLFVPNENKKLPPDLTPRPELEVRHGDFLMGRANTTELTGACAIVVDPPSRLLLCDKIFRFHFKPNAQIDTRYLDYALKSKALREQIEAAATGTSSSMKNISKDKALRLRIPLPPLSEQRRMVAHLDRIRAKVDVLGRLQAESAVELNALLPAVLERAFRGEP